MTMIESLICISPMQSSIWPAHDSIKYGIKPTDLTISQELKGTDLWNCIYFYIRLPLRQEILAKLTVEKRLLICPLLFHATSSC
jgi:hypothetical protein